MLVINTAEHECNTQIYLIILTLLKIKSVLQKQ